MPDKHSHQRSCAHLFLRIVSFTLVLRPLFSMLLASHAGSGVVWHQPNYDGQLKYYSGCYRMASLRNGTLHNPVRTRAKPCAPCCATANGDCARNCTYTQTILYQDDATCFTGPLASRYGVAPCLPIHLRPWAQPHGTLQFIFSVPVELAGPSVPPPVAGGILPRPVRFSDSPR